MNHYQHKRSITLSQQERERVCALLRKGRHSARATLRARVLLKSHEGWKDREIARDVGVHHTTVERIRARFAEGGLDRALYDAPRSGQPKKLDEKAEAHLVALACSDPPEGRARWTLALLQQRMIEDKRVKSISDVCLLRYLQNRQIKPWVEKNVVRTHADA